MPMISSHLLCRRWGRWKVLQQMAQQSGECAAEARVQLMQGRLASILQQLCPSLGQFRRQTLTRKLQDASSEEA